ncbi:Adenosylcobinamide hydrolase [Methanosalsum zhilinae DSM 4017]|uniref:Adenosylcobinamide hydrolase n=1 Tax=Methanosalsum zhilinae (strain DSM 4017 / NBRC 107636 / OCM 62 / WeN5) TaxID=679901 RepID=F7XLG9_METZD|nr:adenosylcobinamide amidohydrolase [Methanosalsum zhilinae]AEH60634.1 Adenosylcobinamide hydrolase [Methanosalsum zhilinae DSM 4017]
MKYFIKNETLIINGDFEALSTGINGGRCAVNCLFNHTVESEFDRVLPKEYLNSVASSHDIIEPYFGLLTAVDMDNLCVEIDEYMTVFVTAGITHPSPFRTKSIGTINIIIVARANVSEGAMAGAIITATEAKSKALIDMGFDFLGTTTDAVIIATENVAQKKLQNIEYSGSYTDFGSKITKAVTKCVKESIRKTHPEYR